LVSGRRYNSWINRMMFGLSSFESPFWLTRRQALNLGAEIPEGEEPTPVVSIWWRQVEINNNPGKFRLIPKYRYCPVFNYEQCRGLKKIPKAPVVETFTHDPIVAAEAIVAAMPNPPTIEDGGGRAAYDLIRDVVLMPKPEHFERRAAYYEVLFHELAHSTAHKCRLNRALPEFECWGDWVFFQPGQEELIAEMTAAFLCGQARIFDQILDNSAAYLNYWLTVLRGDNRLVVKAAAQAQKAADYILGRIPSC